MMTKIKWYCPVCGLDLNKLSHDKEGIIKDVTQVMLALDYEICPCCSMEFGRGDGLELEKDRELYRRLRREWIQGGMRWKHQDEGSLEMKPKNWDPKKQLENIPPEFK